MQRNIFINESDQRKFEEDGFIVTNFLEHHDVEYLLNLYQSLDSGENKGFHASSHIDSIEYRRKVSDEVSSIFGNKASELMQGYRTHYAAYTVKEIGEDSFFDLHLDWTMVNERDYISVTIWCPLVDVNEENGNLWVLRGSHKMGYSIRGGPGLFLYSQENFDSIKEKKFQKLKMDLKRGEAVIYDHRVFHGSPPNLSGSRRIAINQCLVPTEAQPLHYHLKDENEIEVYQVDSDFYNRYKMGKEPGDVPCIETIKIKPNFLQQWQVNSLVADINTME